MAQHFIESKHGNSAVMFSVFPRMEIPQAFQAPVPAFDYPHYGNFFFPPI